MMAENVLPASVPLPKDLRACLIFNSDLFLIVLPFRHVSFVLHLTHSMIILWAKLFRWCSSIFKVMQEVSLQVLHLVKSLIKFDKIGYIIYIVGMVFWKFVIT